MKSHSLLLALLLALLPLAFGLWVNATAPHAPTKAYVPARCTRYCTTHGCRHATPANSPVYFQLRPLYAATIAALSVGGKARYEGLNIGFYLLFIPSLLIWLTHGALRDGKRIKQLKRQLRS